MERFHRAGDGSLIPAFDAVILAGGRASRLGGHPKPQLSYKGATLLDHAVEAADGARVTVVVGPAPGEQGGPAAPPDGPGGGGRARAVLYTREEPPYAGPLAALGAGLAALEGHAGPVPGWVVVVAADLPRARDAVAALLGGAARERARDGILGEDEEGRLQPLLAAYRREALAAVLQQLSADGGLADRPMRHLIARLDLLPLRLPPGVSVDVDTWEAAQRWGIERPGTDGVPGAAPQQEEAP